MPNLPQRMLRILSDARVWRHKIETAYDRVELALSAHITLLKQWKQSNISVLSQIVKEVNAMKKYCGNTTR